LSDWPRLLRPLVEEHGEAAVAAAGLKTLGYPGTLAHTNNEIHAMQEVLSDGMGS